MSGSEGQTERQLPHIFEDLIFRAEREGLSLAATQIAEQNAKAELKIARESRISADEQFYSTRKDFSTLAINRWGETIDGAEVAEVSEVFFRLDGVRPKEAERRAGLLGQIATSQEAALFWDPNVTRPKVEVTTFHPDDNGNTKLRLMLAGKSSLDGHEATIAKPTDNFPVLGANVFTYDHNASKGWTVGRNLEHVLPVDHSLTVLTTDSYLGGLENAHSGERFIVVGKTAIYESLGFIAGSMKQGGGAYAIDGPGGSILDQLLGKILDGQPIDLGATGVTLADIELVHADNFRNFLKGHAGDSRITGHGMLLDKHAAKRALELGLHFSQSYNTHNDRSPLKSRVVLKDHIGNLVALQNLMTIHLKKHMVEAGYKNIEDILSNEYVSGGIGQYVAAVAIAEANSNLRWPRRSSVVRRIRKQLG